MVEHLPTINAALNVIATALLLRGYWLIKHGREQEHIRAMLSAFGVSILFLACYVAYHLKAGSVQFAGPPAVRVGYLAMLATHIVLAAAVPFLAGATIYLGYFNRAAHRPLARWTFPIWLYVSITGVLIYLMLYHVYPSPRTTDTMIESATQISNTPGP